MSSIEDGAAEEDFCIRSAPIFFPAQPRKACTAKADRPVADADAELAWVVDGGDGALLGVRRPVAEQAAAAAEAELARAATVAASPWQPRRPWR